MFMYSRKNTHRRRAGGGLMRFYWGDSIIPAAELLLNLIAVTILANFETLDIAKKDSIHTY